MASTLTDTDYTGKSLYYSNPLILEHIIPSLMNLFKHDTRPTSLPGYPLFPFLSGPLPIQSLLDPTHSVSSSDLSK
jgi:hypothetical protein